MQTEKKLRRSSVRLTLLELEYQLWKAIAAGKAVDAGWGPLCDRYKPKPEYSGQQVQCDAACPVKALTGFNYCCMTPYRLWHFHQGHAHGKDGSEGKEMQVVKGCDNCIKYSADTRDFIGRLRDREAERCQM